MLKKPSVVLITNDPRLGAAISSAFAMPGAYFPVFEGPRMKRPDTSNEVIRLVNVLRRLNPALIIYANQEPEVVEEIGRIIKSGVIQFDESDECFGYAGVQLPRSVTPSSAAMELHRLHGSFGKETAVVCDTGATITSVIAANYAIAHEADFFMVEPPTGFNDRVLAKLNTISDTTHKDIRAIDIAALKDELANVLPKLVHWAQYKKILFISEGTPYSLCMPSLYTVHAPITNLGQFLASNIYESLSVQQRRAGVIGMFVNNLDGQTVKEEYECFEQALTKARGFLCFRDAHNSKLSEYELESFPYDILYIAAHGNQVAGYKATYTYKHSDGLEHEIVVNEANGVTGRIIFIESVDGVIKDGKGWTEELAHIWGDFATKFMKLKDRMKPVIGEQVMLPMRQLVLGSDTNGGMASPISSHHLAGQRRPLVIVNACGSWGDLVSRFTFAGASSYIGTLWPVSNGVAKAFTVKFLGKLFEIELITAFHEARLSLADGQDQFTYIVTGSFETRFNPLPEYTISGKDELIHRLKHASAAVRRAIVEKPEAPKDIMNSREIDTWYFAKTLKEIKKVR
jgi:hypothetical protein